MPNNLSNNFILVTGASSGIGRSIAIELSKNNNVIINGRDQKKLDATKSLCCSQNKLLIFPYDLSDINNLESALIKFILENDITISKFVHSAGIMEMLPVKMISAAAINSCFNINLISPLLIIKTLNHRKHNQNALENVVFISSNISNMGAKAFSIYGASKSGADGLMRNLAIELAPKVRVNSVLPGAIETEMTKDIFSNQEKIKQIEATYPLGIGKTQDIADAVEFLLSEKARWITGQQLTVDGGRSINISG